MTAQLNPTLSGFVTTNVQQGSATESEGHDQNSTRQQRVTKHVNS